jgi:hypothetical protein
MTPEQRKAFEEWLRDARTNYWRQSLGMILQRGFLAGWQAGAAAKQAEIDRLMLEYCPDEMTPEQISERALSAADRPASVAAPWCPAAGHNR